MADIIVKFDRTEVKSGIPYHDNISENLYIYWKSDPYDWFTLILSHMENGLYHADSVITNIPSNRIEQGEIIIQLQPNTIHRGRNYFIDILRHVSRQKLDNLENRPYPYPLSEYLQNNLIFEPYIHFDLNLNSHFITDRASPRLTGWDAPRRPNQGCGCRDRASPRLTGWDAPRRPNQGCGCRDRASPTYMDEIEQKYCRCVLDVASKQDEDCLGDKKRWGGGKCYNPYAVCSKSTHSTSQRCGTYYEFDKLPDEKLKAYGILSRISIPDPYDREQMLQNIEEWKRIKYSK